MSVHTIGPRKGKKRLGVFTTENLTGILCDKCLALGDIDRLLEIQKGPLPEARAQLEEPEDKSLRIPHCKNNAALSRSVDRGCDLCIFVLSQVEGHGGGLAFDNWYKIYDDKGRALDVDLIFVQFEKLWGAPTLCFRHIQEPSYTDISLKFASFQLRADVGK